LELAKESLSLCCKLKEKSANYALPVLNFEGPPTGIDMRKVIETGITPVINTGIAHKKAGIGQVGAGVMRAPVDCFKQALEAMVNKLGV